MLLLLQNRKFGSYWFESDTPAFLVSVPKQRGIFILQQGCMQSKTQLLSQFDVNDISTEALLFQAGYITTKDIQEPLPGFEFYTLGFPNREVESNLNDVLLPVLGFSHNEVQPHQIVLLDMLQHKDLNDLYIPPQSLYASNNGRVDMTVNFDDHIYVFEFKVVELLPDGKALEQLKAKGYADKYHISGKTIHPTGVDFSSQQR